jgi:DNA-binding Xre family transcriptional regulator
LEKLTSEQIDRLFIIKHKKKIKNKDIAEKIGYSETSISRFFSHTGLLSVETENLIKEVIETA